MWKTIEKLRGEPEDARRGAAFFGAFAITAFLLVSWMVLPSAREKESGEVKSAEDLISPFAAVGRVFSTGAGEIAENFSEAKEVLNENAKLAAEQAAISTSTIATTTASTTPDSEFLAASSSATTTKSTF